MTSCHFKEDGVFEPRGTLLLREAQCFNLATSQYGYIMHRRKRTKTTKQLLQQKTLGGKVLQLLSPQPLPGSQNPWLCINRNHPFLFVISESYLNRAEAESRNPKSIYLLMKMKGKETIEYKIAHNSPIMNIISTSS